MSLSRFFTRLPNRLRRAVNNWKKDTKVMLYDIRRAKKSTWHLIYQTVTVVTVIGSSAYYLMMNFYYTENLRDRQTLQVDGKPVELDGHLELLALREWNFSHVPRKTKLMDLLKFFPCKGSQPYLIGDLESRCGVFVGLPHNFSYKTIDDVNLKELKIVGQNAETFAQSKLDALSQLKEALVLSDNAKRFAITREIHLSDNFRIITETCNIAISTFLGVGLGSHFILTRNIRQRYLMSLAIRSASAAFGLCLWFIVRQMYYYSWNLSADAETVKQGLDYIEGGLEYYKKVMQKNAALFVLLGEQGRKMFTEDGEEKGLFSTVPSFKKRIEKIEEMAPKDEEENDNSNDS